MQQAARKVAASDALDQISPMEAAIRVLDLDGMVDFYLRALSCKELRRGIIPVELGQALALAPEEYPCVWLQTPGGERIKLISRTAPPAPLELPDYITDRRGIAYLTFRCSDLDDVLNTAQAAGARLRSDGVVDAPQRGLRICFLTDPEGNFLELVEPRPAPR